MAAIRLVIPSQAELPQYVAALRGGWSPANLRGAEVAAEHLARIAADPEAFLAGLQDEAATGGPVRLPDGSTVPRLPGFARWIWDGTFCGAISFRWQPGGSTLPSHVLGHVGYAVVPWKRNAGCARQALRLLLPEARRRGLDHVELTTDPDNVASQRVILACGGVLAGRFTEPPSFGGAEALRYRIDLRDLDPAGVTPGAA